MDASESDSDSYIGSAASIAVIQETGEAKVIEQIDKAFDPLPLDRAIVVETQHSALLNALTQDLTRLKAESQEYVNSIAGDTAKWHSLLRKTGANVEWLKTRVAQLVAKQKAAAPIEYAQAESQVVLRENTD